MCVPYHHVRYPITCVLLWWVVLLSISTELGLVTGKWEDQENEVDADKEEGKENKNSPSSTS